METRELLYFNLTANHELPIAEISAAQWAVHPESDLNGIKEEINERDFLVAHPLDVVTDKVPGFKIETLFPIRSPIEWVALLAQAGWTQTRVSA